MGYSSKISITHKNSEHIHQLRAIQTKVSVTYQQVSEVIVN